MVKYVQIISSTTSSGQWREFSWKNAVRFFITPRRKYLQTGIAESGHCWRQCNHTMADHYHIFLNCAAIQPYWLDIMSEIKSILGFEINFNFGNVYLAGLENEIIFQSFRSERNRYI